MLQDVATIELGSDDANAYRVPGTDVSGIPETSDVKHQCVYNWEQTPRIIQDIHLLNIDHSKRV